MPHRLLFFFVLSAVLFHPVLPAMGQSFTAADLAGTWHGHQLVTGDAPANDPRWSYGTLVVDSSGNYTATWTDPSVVSPGTIQIFSNGTITFNNQSLTHGVLNDGKDLIVLVDGTPAAGGNGLTILVKRNAGASFSTADLAGTWYGHEIISGDEPGESPQWAYGTVTISSSGSFTGTWTDSSSTDIISGSVAITAGGVITVNNQPLNHGVMNDNKDLIVLMEGPPSLNGNGLNVLVKRGAGESFSTGDLAGTWYGHHVVSGDAPAEDPRWGHGTALINTSGQYTVNWTSPTQANEISAGTMQITANGILTINNQPLTHGILNDARDMFVFIDGTDESGGNALSVFVNRVPPPLSGSLHMLLFKTLPSQ